MSVYRDMLKKVEGRPEDGAPPRSDAPGFPALDRFRPELESLSSKIESLSDRYRSIVFSGVDSGVGVSTVSLTVATHLAELHPGEVVYLDVNSRSSRASLVEAHAAADSFYQVFRQTDGELSLPRAGALHVLSARQDRMALGKLPQKDLVAFFERLKARFRWVLVDAPPASHPESLIWSMVSDGTILVIEAGRTRRHAAKAMVEQLASMKFDLLGTVLNRRQMVIPDWIYKLLFK